MTAWPITNLKLLSFTDRFTDLDKPNLFELAYGGLVLGSSQFLLLPQLPHKMMLVSKVVKSNSKIIIPQRQSKSVTHSVASKHIHRRLGFECRSSLVGFRYLVLDRYFLDQLSHKAYLCSPYGSTTLSLTLFCESPTRPLPNVDKHTVLDNLFNFG